MKLVFDLSWNLLNISHITNAQVTTFSPWNHASLRICPLLTTMPDAWQVFIISHFLRECSLAYGWLLICMYLKLLCLDCLEMSLNTVFQQPSLIAEFQVDDKIRMVDWNIICLVLRVGEVLPMIGTVPSFLFHLIRSFLWG